MTKKQIKESKLKQEILLGLSKVPVEKLEEIAEIVRMHNAIHNFGIKFHCIIDHERGLVN